PLLALLAACSDSAGPGGDVRVNALLNAEVPPYGTNVSVTVENVGSRPVLVPRCGDRIMLVVERRVGGAWQDYTGDYCAFDVLSVPLELAPGARATSARHLGEPGRYRARVDVWHADAPDDVHTVRTAGFDIL
ncbi:MAG TPA: hypothetical protein VLK84_22320, partial [Longimicrobium sp.]|nr:hypothetical protein [Longimicrobium sp.]